MNRFPTLMVLAALAGLVSGCRKSLREPPDWNLEKHLGQRNRGDSRAAPAYAHDREAPQTSPAPESFTALHVDEPVAQEAPEAPQTMGEEQPPAVEPAVAPLRKSQRPPRYNVPRSTRGLRAVEDD